MANTAEGLEKAPTGEQVNSEQGFAAALAAKGVEPDKATSSDTSVAGGLETVGPATGRDPATGQFVPKADTSQSVEDTSTGEQFTSDDPAIASFLAKYGGNVEEAIKGAANAQALIGKRDEERDTLAQQVAELRGLVDGLKAGVSQPQQNVTFLADEEVEERAATRIQALGYEGASKEAAEWANLTGDERALQTIFEQWNIEDPWAATNFIAEHRTAQALAKVTPAAATPDPFFVNQKAEAEMAQTFKALEAQVGKEAMGKLTALDADGSSHLAKALDEMPKQVIDLIASDDAETRLAGARILADRALNIAGTAPAAPAVQGKTDEGMPESVRRKLLGAGVATAGLRPASAAPEGGSTETDKESAIAAFKSAIVAAETTSVASGLTYGPQGK